VLEKKVMEKKCPGEEMVKRTNDKHYTVKTR
jgi:hypothetical protein